MCTQAGPQNYYTFWANGKLVDLPNPARFSSLTVLASVASRAFLLFRRHAWGESFRSNKGSNFPLQSPMVPMLVTMVFSLQTEPNGAHFVHRSGSIAEADGHWIVSNPMKYLEVPKSAWIKTSISCGGGMGSNEQGARKTLVTSSHGDADCRSTFAELDSRRRSCQRARKGSATSLHAYFKRCLFTTRFLLSRSFRRPTRPHPC